MNKIIMVHNCDRGDIYIYITFTFVKILGIIKSLNSQLSKSCRLIIWTSFHASATFFLKEYVP